MLMMLLKGTNLYKFILKKCTNLNSTIVKIYRCLFQTTGHDFAHPCTMVPNTIYGSNGAVTFQEIVCTLVNLQGILLICNQSSSAEHPLAYTTVSHNEHQVFFFFFTFITDTHSLWSHSHQFCFSQKIVNVLYSIWFKQNDSTNTSESSFLIKKKHKIIPQGTMCLFSVQ